MLDHSSFLFGYVGLGAGQELFPYFVALLALLGTALSAVLQWPLSLLYRFFSRARSNAPGELAGIPVRTHHAGVAE